PRSANTLAAAASRRRRTSARGARGVGPAGSPAVPAGAALAAAAAPPAAAPRAAPGRGKTRPAGRPAAGAAPAVVASPAAAWAAFSAALDDDLGVSRALAALFGAVAEGNLVLSKTHRGELAGWLVVVRRMLTVLGLDPVTQWPAAGGQVRAALDGVMEIVRDLRSSARARLDYTEADSIRDRLRDAGVIVDDTGEGQRWHLA
ncbi:DALR domain-containing protein, partial [Frankia sp. AgW1.1]|uniref:DALR domain-containing protein n=1 Tax=Frankia sp. AgW1.1 TaxID=1836971 RepID=UPI0027DDC7BA